MWRNWLGLLGTLLVACAGVACGARPEVRAPEGVALPRALPAAAKAPPAPAPAERPARTAAWLHLEDPATLALALSALRSSSLGAKEEALDAYLDSIDLERPIDVAVSLRDTKDTDVAVRLSLRDSKAFFKALSADYALREEGERIRLVKKGGAEPDAKPSDESASDVICEFDPPARSSDTAVCGTGHGLALFRDWLRTGPRPTASPSMQPLVQLTFYAAALRERFAAELAPRRSGEGDSAGAEGDWTGELRRFAEDADSVSFEVARDGLSLVVSAELALRSQTSSAVRDLLAPAHPGPPPPAFFSLAEDASVAAFSPGGGPLPRWIEGLILAEGRSLPEGARAKVTAAGTAVAALLGRPFAASYGVHVERAKAAVVAIRSGKEPAKARKALDQALEGHGVVATSTDVATVERTARAVIAAEAASATPTPGPKAPSPAPGTTRAVRAAAAGLGLPRGSFFLDETKVDPAPREATGKGERRGPRMKTESTLLVPQGDATWAFLGDEERGLVDSAKRTLSAPPPARAVDPLLRRPGLILGGYVSSFAGAFAMRGLTSAFFASGAPNDDLVELEKELSAPRLPIWFALTAARRGEGGVARLESKGDVEAFKRVAAKSGVAAAGLALLVYALVLAGP